MRAPTKMIVIAAAVLGAACGKSKSSSDQAPVASGSASGSGSGTASAVAPAGPPVVQVPQVAAASTIPLHSTDFIVIKANGDRGVGIQRDQGGDAFDLSAVAVTDAGFKKVAVAPEEDPPPPPPDPREEEYGATGTEMALDEGKMGKKDSDRAEGQYHMKKNDADPQLARAQALEEARNNGGILGQLSKDQQGAFASLTGTGDAAPTEQVGVVVAVPSPSDAKVVVADRDAGARDVVRELLGHGGVIAVSTDGGAHARAFHMIFGVAPAGDPGPPIDPQIELTLDDKATDADLASTYKTERAKRPGGDRFDARLYLGDKISNARMITALDALIGAGATRIAVSLDHMKTGTPPTVTIGAPTNAKDYDKQVIRSKMKGSLAKVTSCYEKQLLNTPGLEGTVTVKFVIGRDGHVLDASASGVDPKVASCVADVVKALVFPKPDGGIVNVSYPFSFHPSGQ